MRTVQSMVRSLHRNSIVHQVKEMTKGTCIAKCGAVFKQFPFGTKDKPHGTVFSSRITCEEGCKGQRNEEEIVW